MTEYVYLVEYFCEDHWTSFAVCKDEYSLNVLLETLRSDISSCSGLRWTKLFYSDSFDEKEFKLLRDLISYRWENFSIN